MDNRRHFAGATSLCNSLKRPRADSPAQPALSCESCVLSDHGVSDRQEDYSAANDSRVSFVDCVCLGPGAQSATQTRGLGHRHVTSFWHWLAIEHDAMHVALALRIPLRHVMFHEG